MELTLPLLVAGLMAIGIWSLFSIKGREQQFGGKFTWSSEPHISRGPLGSKKILIVHKITPKDISKTPFIGLEYHRTMILNISMRTIPLSNEVALELSRSLERAGS